MKNHQSACVILIIFICGMLYGVNQLRNAASSAREIASKAKIDTETTAQQTQLAQIQLKSLEAKTAMLRKVYEEWKPYFEALRSAPDAEQRIVEIIREGEVFVLSQKFQTISIDKTSIIAEALVADLVVDDDYARALNWLGRLEEALPSCRITKCVINSGDRGNDIHMVLQVQVPILKS